MGDPTTGEASGGRFGPCMRAGAECDGVRGAGGTRSGEPVTGRGAAATARSRRCCWPLRRSASKSSKPADGWSRSAAIRRSALWTREAWPGRRWATQALRRAVPSCSCMGPSAAHGKRMRSMGSQRRPSARARPECTRLRPGASCRASCRCRWLRCRLRRHPSARRAGCAPVQSAAGSWVARLPSTRAARPQGRRPTPAHALAQRRRPGGRSALAGVGLPRLRRRRRRHLLWGSNNECDSDRRATVRGRRKQTEAGAAGVARKPTHRERPRLPRRRCTRGTLRRRPTSSAARATLRRSRRRWSRRRPECRA